jgi:aspartate 1-decarboxylase
MKTKFLAAKLHCVKVTQTELDYHGSITLDRNFLELSGMKPLEFVCIWNKGNGNRFETYIIPGERGSKVCCLNGAAAHLVNEDDEVIIASYRYVDVDAEEKTISARVVLFGKSNEIEKVLIQNTDIHTGDFDESELEGLSLGNPA